MIPFSLLQKRLLQNVMNYATPNFMIIGAPKSGTTSLFHYLCQHPDIIPPKQKEPAYFDWNRNKGFKWYLSQFPTKSKCKNKLTFEATPSYLFRKNVPSEVKSLFPNSKFIILLRNPIDRAFSHWNFYHNSNFVQGKEMYDSRTFEVAIKEEMNGKKEQPFYWNYLSLGKYAEQIESWFNCFPNESFLFLDFEDLISNPKLLLKNCTSFLNISDVYEKFSISKEAINNLKDKPVYEECTLRIHNFNSYNRNIETDTYDLLREYYHVPNMELRSLINTDLQWLEC